MRRHQQNISLALGLFLLTGMTGCGTTTEPENANAAVASTAVPSLTKITADLDLTTSQAEKLVAPHTRWSAAENRDQPSDGNPAVGFIAESAPILDRSQLLGLIVNVRENRVQENETFRSRRGRGGRGDQGGIGPRGGIGPNGERGQGIGLVLDLTDEQKTAMQEIRERLHSTMSALHQSRIDGSITVVEFRTAARDARTAMRSAVEAILTDDQVAALEAHQLARMVEQLERRIERFDAATSRKLSHLTQILGLDEAQGTAIAQILEAVKPELSLVLTGLQNDEVSSEDARATLQNLRESTREALMSQLNDDQLEVFEELNTLRHRPRFGRRGPS